MDSDRPVLVIGAAGVDIKARAYEPLAMGYSNPGTIRQGVGGVARNIAENLARLEVPTILLTALGDDHAGDYVFEHTAEAGVDMRRVLRLADTHTGTYVAVQDAAAQLVVSISEYDIVNAITPSYIQHNRALFARSSMVVVDANLTARTLNSIFHWAKRYGVPVCADPTSPMLAPKLCEYLSDLTMVAPNASEAAALCGWSEPCSSTEKALEAAQCLVSQGVMMAIVTLAEQGLAYAGGRSAGHIPALTTQVIDATGVGDALTAAVIFGLVNDMPFDEAVRLGVAAAALTLRAYDTVVHDLSLDRLYNQLIV